MRNGMLWRCGTAAGLLAVGMLLMWWCGVADAPTDDPAVGRPEAHVVPAATPVREPIASVDGQVIREVLAADAAVRILVHDESSGAAIDGAAVFFADLHARQPLGLDRRPLGSTDAEGQFVTTGSAVRNACAGLREPGFVVVAAAHLAAATHWLPEQVEYAVVLRAASRLTLHFVDPKAAPVAGVHVYASMTPFSCDPTALSIVDRSQNLPGLERSIVHAESDAHGVAVLDVSGDAPLLLYASHEFFVPGGTLGTGEPLLVPLAGLESTCTMIPMLAAYALLPRDAVAKTRAHADGHGITTTGSYLDVFHAAAARLRRQYASDADLVLALVGVPSIVGAEAGQATFEWSGDGLVWESAKVGCVSLERAMHEAPVLLHTSLRKIPSGGVTVHAQTPSGKALVGLPILFRFDAIGGGGLPRQSGVTDRRQDLFPGTWRVLPTDGFSFHGPATVTVLEGEHEEVALEVDSELRAVAFQLADADEFVPSFALTVFAGERRVLGHLGGGAGIPVQWIAPGDYEVRYRAGLDAARSQRFTVSASDATVPAPPFVVELK